MNRPLRVIALAIAALFVVSLAMFLLLFIGPNPAAQLANNPDYSPADIARLVHENGWDQPWPQQYVHWITGFLSGDWGTSVTTHRSVRAMIMERLPLTLMLTGSAELLSLLLAIPLGIALAHRRDSALDRGAAIISFAVLAAPSFLIALFLQAAALKLDHATGAVVLPTAGAPTGGLFSHVHRLILPVLSLAIVQSLAWSRFQRNEMIRALSSNYILAARAKGLPERWLHFRQALPNTLIPVLTIVAMDVAALIGGAIGTETIFGLPGIGGLLISSVNTHDVAVALDIVVVAAAAMVVANALMDLLHGRLDRRVRDRQ